MEALASKASFIAAGQFMEKDHNNQSH